MADDVAILRQILQRELETINAYEEMSERILDPALRQIVEHITDEEREHVAEMYELIIERDAKQKAYAGNGRQHLEAARGAAPADAPPVPSEEARVPVLLPGGAIDLIPPPPLVFPTASFSVGSLKRLS